MLSPTIAAILVLVIGLVLMIVVPILDGTGRFSKFISLRYTLVAVALSMALGCILDFSYLAESSRNIVLMGSLILVGIFIVVRTLEKMKLGNKVIELTAKKDDIELSAKLHNQPANTEESKLHKVFEATSLDNKSNCSLDKNYLDENDK